MLKSYQGTLRKPLIVRGNTGRGVKGTMAGKLSVFKLFWISIVLEIIVDSASVTEAVMVPDAVVTTGDVNLNMYFLE